ncbi:hypothetical protein [Streptomyces europaeiscabiei]|uniref:hypothetical protein n=1 Tax=Streptomyces europaeiscabiei TaxID=146819 RepID=UPI002E1471D1|nr:hypothetical protein OHB30_21565 [Streptomyces europaeiscabiei]
MEHVREGLNAQLRALIGITAGIPLGPGMGVPDGQGGPAAVADPSCPLCGLSAEHPGQDGPAIGSVPLDSVTSPR